MRGSYHRMEAFSYANKANESNFLISAEYILCYLSKARVIAFSFLARCSVPYSRRIRTALALRLSNVQSIRRLAIYPLRALCGRFRYLPIPPNEKDHMRANRRRID